ncbi:MAG TPA: HepT-like ribonuclease domain-containing protein [Nannocystaceae bacterium]|nr:HepT-like ribonuclease domain-containing protein [Nannocystaceae bacterium]
MSDDATQDRAARNAQLLAQTCADIALHILAAGGEAAPETYAAALVELARLGRIPASIGQSLAAAVGLRDLLVHAYLDVDYGRVHDELGWIDDAVTFAAAIEPSLESLESP